MKEFFEVLLCFFAVVGFYELCRIALNYFSAKRLRFSCFIFVEKIEKQSDIEFTLRVLEGILKRQKFNGKISGIMLGKGVNISDALFQRLQKEFGNIWR